MLQLQHSSLIKTIAKKGKQFPELFVAIVTLNQAVLFTNLQHLYVLPFVTFLSEIKLAYVTYHAHILFFKRYVCTLMHSILVYSYPSSHAASGPSLLSSLLHRADSCEAVWC